MGWLNKNSSITINYSLPEGGSISPDNYQVKILHPIQITIPPKTLNVNGKLITYHFVKWEDGNTSNPRTIYTSHDVSLNAIMKGTTLSDDPYAYSNTSQRKFVRTDDGWLLSTYSSMGRIWFESSSDNGTTWKIANNDNKPVDDGEAKLPSICNLLYNYEGFDNRFAIIVYKEKFGSGFKIKAKCYKRWDDQIVYVYQNEVTLASYTSESYSNNANPVLAVDSDRYITFVWEQKSGTAAGLYRRNQRCEISGLTSTGSNTKLNYTNSSSLNPAITISTDMQRHIVWQSPGIINSIDILYGTTTITGNFTEQPTNISSGNGYPSNYSPCISLANGKPVVSWTGYFDGNMHKITGEQDEIMRVRALVKVKGANGWPSVCTELGDNVNYVNNNSVTSSSEKTVFVWSQGTTPQSKWVRRDGSSSSGQFSNIGSLSHSGIENQVTTGTNFDNMTAMVFNKQTVPFYFIKSTTNFSQDPIGGGIEKIGTLEQISYGRSGIINKQGVEFVFNIGDVFVADSSIQFTFVPDTILFNSEQELNTAARTENFWLEEGVDFYFSNLYYVIRQELADSVLTEQDLVNFKVELVRAQSGEVIGAFDNITYNKNNLEKYASINYQVNCSGIQAGEYYLRLVTTVAGYAAYNLSNIQRGEFDLNKLNYVNVSFKGETIPVTYELSQNYPNPFNPTTTIRYQLPKDGMVTLKVYDILGAEVVTLVNEEKVAGKYEVNFNASNLASGVYIYRLNVNDYVSVKKMVLLK